eukprot:1501091-Heterocapsa_arctica.AAC.1
MTEDDLAFIFCDLRNVLSSDHAARMFAASVTHHMESEDTTGVRSKSRVQRFLDNLDPVIGM